MEFDLNLYVTEFDGEQVEELDLFSNEMNWLLDQNIFLDPDEWLEELIESFDDI
jgi:hypothetical protein